MLENSVESALALQDGSADGCLVQTVDRVYAPQDESDPARTAAVALIVQEIVRATKESFVVGVHMMRNALKPSLAVAKVAGGSFIRATALVGASIASEGFIEGAPLEVAEYRTKIDAWDIKVIADIDTMHFRWLGREKTTPEVARAAKQVGADAVAVSHPEEKTALGMIASVKDAAPGLPVFVAGHTNHENAARLLGAADGAFVGSCFEQGGPGGPIDVERVKAYVEIVRDLER